MKIQDLPQAVISQTIDAIIKANPGVPMSRGDWFEYIEENYQVRVEVVNGYTHYFLDPIVRPMNSIKDSIEEWIG